MTRSHLLAPALALVCLCPAAAPAEGKKYALVVGVTEYSHDRLPSLSYTENDAEELAKALRDPRAGFASVRVMTVTRGKADAADAPTAANLGKAIRGLIEGKHRKDTILFAFAGHGVQVEVSDPDGKGRPRTYPYLCPSDADLGQPVSYSTGACKTLVNLDDFFKQLGASGAGTRLVLLDACRNEVDAESASRGVDGKRLALPRGVGALFSCAPGERAWETRKLNKERGHGVFFYHVIEGLRGAARNEDGEVGWDELTSYVRRNVAKKVPVVIGGGATQTPHAMTNLVGSPVLVGRLGEGDELYRKGMNLLQGIGVSRDAKEAAACFEKAAKGGHLLSRAALAWLYDWGPGVGGRDFDKAKRLAGEVAEEIEKAAEAGDADAQYFLGRFCRTGLGVYQDYPRMAYWYQKAVDQGSLLAMIELGLVYRFGWGVTKDHEKALALFRREAKAGGCRGPHYLADMYFEGVGVEKDLAEAAKWHRMAAERGEENSQCQLGYMYGTGTGVEVDLDEAFKLYAKAARAGQVVAMSNLGNCYTHGRGVAKDPEKAFEWYLKSAEGGFAKAQYEVGVRYLAGMGVERDDDKGKDWLRKAAARGHKQAKEKLAELGE